MFSAECITVSSGYSKMKSSQESMIELLQIFGKYQDLTPLIRDKDKWDYELEAGKILDQYQEFLDEFKVQVS